MDGLSDLGFFALVARLNSLTAAGRELGVTTPSVSKRLAQIERRLGVRLMNRTTRRISLTAEGELYLKQGARILSEMAELDQMVSASRVTPTGMLRVNASFGFGREHVAPIISSFIEQYGGMQIQLQLTDRPMNLPDQAYDVGIRFGAFADARFTARRLLGNRRMVCAAPAYLAQRGVPNTPHDLNRHACLVVRENESNFGTWHFTRARHSETVKVSGPLSSNDGNAVLRWALDGHGIVVRSEWEVREHLQSGRLVELLPAWTLPEADIYAAYLERHQLSARLRAFVDYLRPALEQRIGSITP